MMQGDYACNVETPKVQVNLLDGNALCANPNPAVSLRRLLGFRRRSSDAFERVRLAPEIQIPRHRGHPHAHPSGHTFIFNIFGPNYIFLFQIFYYFFD